MSWAMTAVVIVGILAHLAAVVIEVRRGRSLAGSVTFALMNQVAILGFLALMIVWGHPGSALWFVGTANACALLLFACEVEAEHRERVQSRMDAPGLDE